MLVSKEYKSAIAAISGKSAVSLPESQPATETARILLIGDSRVALREIKNQLYTDFHLSTARNGSDAWRKLQSPGENFDVIIFDLDDGGPGNSRFLDLIRQHHPQACLVVVSDCQDVQFAIQLLRAGVYDYVNKTGIGADYFPALIRKWQHEQSLDWKLAEYVRLHREVMRCMEVRTFLAVDVQKSFDLKTGEDPFLSQYTFYLYQRFIERCVSKFGGRIHSTAGDGTMICFGQAWDAIQAACSIVQRISEFNRMENWLAQDFRLRLGIHTGPVVLSENASVSGLFSRTLDIAGHIQKDAVPDRVEVSEETLSAIAEKHLFLPSKRVVDGIRIYYLAQQADLGR